MKIVIWFSEICRIINNIQDKSRFIYLVFHEGINETSISEVCSLWQMLVCCQFKEHLTQEDWTSFLPQRAAHRISELNLFLYLRISGVSLCGRVLTGLTLTTEPFRDGSALSASASRASFAYPIRSKGRA